MKKNIIKKENRSLKDYMRDKKILMIGLGKTGIAVINKLSPVVKLLRAVDTNPYLNLEGEIEKIEKIKNFDLEIILDESINGREEILEDIELIIISPGISGSMPLIKKADEKKIPIWSEIELAWKMMPDDEKQNTIAVTGTNGKTTVITLLEKIFIESGMKALACGNIGNPFINTIDDNGNPDLIRVIEISSFQLERIIDFKPHAGLVLNITDDHIDRHFSLDNYADLKFRLFSNMNGEDYGIFNIEDEIIKRKLFENDFFMKNRLNKLTFSLNKDKDADIFLTGEKIFYKIGKQEGTIDISGISLRGVHNILNIMASIAAAKVFGIKDSSLEKTIKNFKTLEHRIEYVKTIKGIECFNDSKATNPDATIKALNSFDKKVTLILGGKDKEMDFSQLLPSLDKKTANIILIGETTNEILALLEKAGSKNYRVYKCNTFEEAVDKGFKVTKPGDIFLLSPACASFDMFRDYKDRGEKFKNLILKR
jgi:UDP-N-acetylmuramoylalanine--D-glutamate ligase